MLNKPGLTNVPGLSSYAKAAGNNIAQNTVNTAPTLTITERTETGVRIVTLNWTTHVANIGGAYYPVAAGALDLNNAHVAAPTTYYVYIELVGNGATVVKTTTNPETIPAFDYAWLSIVRFQSPAGTATIFYVRRAYCANEEILHNIGEWDLLKVPIYLDGGAVTVDAASGEVDMDALDYLRLRFNGTIPVITNGVMLLSDETTTYADLEDATTYLDGSAITAGKYHKVLLGAITSLNAAYPLVLIRQGKPGTEYATLDEAIIDAERVAATGFPLSYRGMVFPLCYVAMLKGDASDLEIVDLRATGITGSGGGGGGGIADHSLLANLGADDHLQYALTDGTRAFTGALDIGGFAIANVGNVDGVDISAHVSDADAHHDTVTLDANADAVLSLATQEIGLDTQTANYVFAGPTSGVAQVPTFRALTAEDMAAGPLLPYAMASDSTTQSIANVANAQVITFDTSVLLSSTGITRTSASRYTINKEGTYLITFSGIASLAALPGNKNIEMWLRVDGADVPNSNTRVQLETAGTVMTMAVCFLYKFNAGQYIEFWTWGDDTDCRWLATAAGAGPVRPAVPSVIMTINMVSGAGLA
jgi:hypothetical protein